MSGFTKIENDVILAIGSRLGSSAYYVYSVLRMHARQSDRCQRSAVKLAADTGMDRSSITRVLAELREAGVISGEVSPGKEPVHVLSEPVAICNMLQNTTCSKMPHNLLHFATQPVVKSDRSLHGSKTLKNEDSRRETPARESVLRYAHDIGMSDAAAIKFFDYWEALGWHKKGQRIVNWDAECRLWNGRESQFGAMSNGTGHRETPAEEAERWAREAIARRKEEQRGRSSSKGSGG